MTDSNWKNYEQVAEYLLNQVAAHFCLGDVQGKQVVPGASGTDWEIDAKGCRLDGESFLVVECKRHTTNGIPQAIAGALAYTIKDVGASGGIIVSPLGLQKGAKKIAESENIVEVILAKNSTKTDYMLKFLDQVHYGMSTKGNISITSSLEIVVMDIDGNVIERRDISD